MENVPASCDYVGGFSSDLMLKDLSLVLTAARGCEHPIVLGAVSHELYEKHHAAGRGALDFSSIIKMYATDLDEA
jgi:3-hydroxyisobutyrate dehydrogenase